MIIFQSKASTEKRNTVFTSNYTLKYPKHGLSFQRNTCAFLTKAFHEILTLSKEGVIFQSKVSTEKRNPVLTTKNTFTYPNQNFSFQNNKCVFQTKTFHEIHTLSKERDYLSKWSLYREKEHCSHF